MKIRTLSEIAKIVKKYYVRHEEELLEDDYIGICDILFRMGHDKLLSNAEVDKFIATIGYYMATRKYVYTTGTGRRIKNDGQGVGVYAWSHHDRKSRIKYLDSLIKKR